MILYMNRNIRFLLILFAFIMILVSLAVSYINIQEGASASVDAGIVPTRRFRPSATRSQTARTLPSVPTVENPLQLQKPNTDGIPTVGANTSAAVDDLMVKDICASTRFKDKCLSTRYLYIPSFINKGKVVPAVEKFCKFDATAKKCLKNG